MTTTELLSSAWDFDPLVLGVSVVAAGAGAMALRRAGLARLGSFAAGVTVFFLALTSPIAVLARGYLFSAHMLQHLLLVLFVPPLLLLGFPPRGQSRAGQPASRSVAPWAMGVGAMWLWHAPTLCNAAAASANVQRLQTVSLVAMGTAFWWPIFAPPLARRLSPMPAMIYLFTACLACTVLGILVTFSPVEICSVYMHPVDSLGALPLLRNGWGVTPKVDQQIGGLLMWVPACLVYAGVILGVLARYYREDESLATPEIVRP